MDSLETKKALGSLLPTGYYWILHPGTKEVLTVKSQEMSPHGRGKEKVTIVKYTQSTLPNRDLLSGGKNVTRTLFHWLEVYFSDLLSALLSFACHACELEGKVKKHL